MKATYLLLGLLGCICVTPLQAQFMLGPAVGMPLDFREAPYGYTEPYTYFHTGLRIQPVELKRFQLLTEILWSRRGRADLHRPYLPQRLDHLEVSVLATWAFVDKKIKFYGLAGPYVAPLIWGRMSFTQIDGTEYQIDWPDPSEKLLEGIEGKFISDLNSHDLGLYLGIGTRTKLGPGRVWLELKYLQGLIPWYKKEICLSSPGHGINLFGNSNSTCLKYGLVSEYHRNFYVSMGYLIPLKF